MSPRFYLVMYVFGLAFSLIQGNINFVKMSILNGQKYRCGQVPCSSFLNTTVSNVRRCQMACTGNGSCAVATFQKTTSLCQLYEFSIQLNGTLIPDSDAVTMIVTENGRNPLGESIVDNHPGSFLVRNPLSFVNSVIYIDCCVTENPHKMLKYTWLNSLQTDLWYVR